MRSPLILSFVMLGACSAAGGPYPSLQPRAAETIDPRIQPSRPMNDRPVTPQLAAQLATLIEQARSAAPAFEPAMASAERLAGSAGARESESWIAAQTALSAAIAARRLTAMALSDIDAIGATRLRAQGGIAPNDLAAIDRAAAEVAAMAQAQTARIAAVQRRLGR